MNNLIIIKRFIKPIKNNNSMENKTKVVEIEIPVGKVAKWVDGVLTLVDEKSQDVTERIKTFEDALDELEVRAANGDNTAKMLYDDWHNVTTDSDDLIAFLQLRIITAALNEGWEPQFTKGERRWYFWYDLITKEQYDKLSAENKNCVVGRGGVGAGAYGASSVLNTSYGSRLAFKSEKLAAYAGRQFAEIYADFCFKPKEVGKQG